MVKFRVHEEEMTQKMAKDFQLITTIFETLRDEI